MADETDHVEKDGEKMLIHWIWFAQLKKISCAQKWQLLQHFSDPEEIYHSDETALREVGFLSADALAVLEEKDLTEALQILQECEDKGIHLLTIADDAYPRRLRNTFDPPMVLYFRGKLPDWNDTPVIGIVGTRKATAYGCNTARQFGAQIAACGALVVSGAADGVDAMAMYGALDAGNPVVGVLGCGVDVVYPKKNQQLFDLTAANGCLISEYPPRTPGNAWHFPQRNRIISGISNGLLVVEAPKKSGALITVERALEQGRDVYAVPGPVDNPFCEGSNALLQDRASAALSGWNVVKEYDALYPGRLKNAAVLQPPLRVAQEPEIPVISKGKSPAPDKKSIDNRDKSTYSVVNKPAPALTQEEQGVLAQIGMEPVLVDELVDRLGLSAGAVKAVLTKLAIKGLTKTHPGGRVSRK